MIFFLIDLCSSLQFFYVKDINQDYISDQRKFYESWLWSFKKQSFEKRGWSVYVLKRL